MRVTGVTKFFGLFRLTTTIFRAERKWKGGQSEQTMTTKEVKGWPIRTDYNNKGSGRGGQSEQTMTTKEVEGVANQNRL